MSKINKIKVNNIEYDIEDTSKQEILISGTNIRTINNQSILGSGNIDIDGGGGSTSGLSTEVKNAILDCFENVAWTNNQGQTYYDALSELFFPPTTLVSISAVFNQGSAVIYDNTSLDSLKQYLTVTALYDDESTETVTNYTLSGTLTAGTSTVTVTYKNKTTTFTVTVTAVPTLSSISAVYTQSGAVYTSDTLDSLKADLVVKAIYSDSSEVTINENDYSLSGALTVGTSTITVSYSGKTTTFNVTVSQAVELSSISAVYTQSGTVYTSDSLNSLKADLVVTATYDDSSTRTVNDYTLSGTLTVGTSTITVTYGGKTTTFTVTVTAVVVSSIDAVFTQGDNVFYNDTATLNDLIPYLVVTANYSDSSTETVTDYTLSGTLTSGISTVTVTYEGKTDTFDVTVTEAGTLPNIYQQVEWIEAKNGPAINTLNSLTVNSEIRCGMQRMGVGVLPNGESYFGRASPSVIMMRAQNGNIFANFLRTKSASFAGSLDSSIHAMILNKTKFSLDGVDKATFSGDMQDLNQTRHVMIFAWPEDDNDKPYRMVWARCSYFQIYDNGNLVTDLVPCYRKADGEIGMYDRVQRAFRTNVGTGAFTKGADV